MKSKTCRLTICCLLALLAAHTNLLAGEMAGESFRVTQPTVVSKATMTGDSFRATCTVGAPVHDVLLQSDSFDATHWTHLLERTWDQISLTLTPGWNLLSLPFSHSGTPDDVLTDADGPICDIVWRWDAEQRRFVALKSGFAGKEGFWAYTRRDATVARISGPASTGTVLDNLRDGWNLVGPRQDRSDVPAEVIAWEWDDGAYVRVDELLRGKGYWLYLLPKH